MTRWIRLRNLVCAAPISLLVTAAIGGWAVNLSAAGIGAAKGVVDYQRDIRPILSDVCYKCHGPDKDARKAKFRLDTQEGALADLGGYRAILPGNLAKSELYKRITSTDPDEKMPPPDSGRQLTPQQIGLLKAWIQQGAKWGAHWSFIAPQRPALPVVKNKNWPRNPVDHFVLARLEQEGWKPSPEADKATLIRRVTLDLTGLPPTPKEIDEFLADKSTGAYEKLVDRLLASSRYGERMAADWLDAARYADTNGYQIDDERTMWRWREWVIKAFNRNQPFDQFTIEQLAGDLLPDASFDQKIATGFNRNHRINGETGIIPEEYRVEYVVDRVDTTATVWLGLTMGCARCHDHKYDPITQKDFYRFFAIFNNVPENGLDGRRGNSIPFLRPALPELEPNIKAAEEQFSAASKALRKVEQSVKSAQVEWEKQALNQKILWTPLTPESAVSQGGATLITQADGSILSSGKRPDKDTYVITARTDLKMITGIRLELLPDESLPQHGPGRHDNGNPVVSEVRLQVASAAKPAAFKTVVLQNPTADFNQQDWNVQGAVDGKPETGWAVHPELGKPHEAVFQTAEGVGYDGGSILTCRIEQNYGGGALIGKLRLSVTRDAYACAISEKVLAALKVAPEKRDETQTQRLTNFFRSISPEFKKASTTVENARRAKDQLLEKVPTSMVMEEMEKPRDAFILMRGQYDKPGEKVDPGVPASLAVGNMEPTNRLGLAKWLVDPAHPLTARVAVNRYWQNYFGTGLVKTVEDFGSQGELPTHPALLDWLATEFTRTGWDIKAMQKLIVMSATYRQSSKLNPKLLEADPDNRLLARGPRFRLPAEMIRDQALLVSGLLAEKIGGPSVRPYQPVGLWEEVSSNPTNRAYVLDTGESLYRRSLYTFWRRTVPPPTMSTFDAPTRETCMVHRSRTSTPLQALALMNDTTYVEAARVLAQRMMTEGGGTPEQRIQYAFRLATARAARPEEMKVLLGDFARRLDEFRADQAGALHLVSVGGSARNDKLDPVELAACTTVASLILNLDETITKQ